MFKLIKWILGGAVTFAVLLVLAILILPQVIDPNDYRQQITDIVKDKTGRDLSLEGDLSISVFPWLGIRTQGLRFSQPPQIGGNMVSVETAQLRVKVAPLLSKRLEIDTVVLKSPKVRLVTLKNGVDSFTGLADKKDQSAKESSNDSAPTEAIALVVQGLALTDGQLIWDDRQAGKRYQVDDLNFVSGNLIGESLADIAASGVLEDSANPQTAQFKLQAQARIDTNTLEATVSELTANVIQGSQSANLQLSQLLVDQNKQIRLQGLIAKVSSDAIDNLPFELTVPTALVDLERQSASLDEANVSAATMLATLRDLDVRNLGDAPRVAGRIDVPAFDATTLIDRIGIEFEPADSSALTSMAFSADLNGDTRQVKLANLTLSMDESQLSGELAVRDFTDPKINFNLLLDQLNIDNYLPERTQDNADSDSVSGAQALVIPMAAFKEVFANGRFQAQQLISGGLELNDIDVDVKSTPGSVTVTPRASLYDGKVGGAIAYSDLGGKQQLRVQNEIDLVDLSKMLNAAEITDQLSGIGSLVLDMTITEQDGVQRNSGTVKLLAKNGALKGIDLKSLVDNAYSQYQSLKGREPEEQTGEAQENDETRFAELVGTFNIDNFKITNNDFSLKAPLFRVGGQGEINIQSQTLDYLVNLSIVNTTRGQGGEALDKLKGLTLPIRFRGDLSNPRYSLDVRGLYKSLVKREVDEKKGEYLREEFGVEGGEALSTKDTIKQVLLNKLLKKDEQKAEQDRQQAAEQSVERPLREAGGGASVSDIQVGNAPDVNANDNAPDVNANGSAPDFNANGSAQAVEEAPVDDRSETDKLKDDLRQRLLESIFN